jgi:hypothetical protein
MRLPLLLLLAAACVEESPKPADLADSQAVDTDDDRDDDGVLDVDDAFPDDPTESADADGDGIGDETDDDDDNDGLLDVDEDALGTDPLHPDSDADGLLDGDDPLPTTPGLPGDTDGDGIADTLDAFPLDPAESADLDGDGTGDASDPDDDDDGLPDVDDPDPRDADADDDGILDGDDPLPLVAGTADDTDGDSVPDTLDAFPLDPAEVTDTDGDGLGDNADVDDDADGLDDVFDAFPLDPTESVDLDADGIGDNADLDDDGDGLPDVDDPAPRDADADDDGLLDGDDALPLVPGTPTDADGDGVLDAFDTFPADPTESADADGDALGDNADPDDDNDGLTDVAELQQGSDPLAADTDGDGLLDPEDALPTVPGSVDDPDGDGFLGDDDAFPSDPLEHVDTDGDGIGNTADDDDDGDGVRDVDDALPLDRLITETPVTAFPLRRLNRLEYDNTLRDLLGITSQPSTAFPPDPAAAGFDTVAESLELTPTLFDQYFLAAQASVEEALLARPAYEETRAQTELGAPLGSPLGPAWALRGGAVDVTFEVPPGPATLVLTAAAAVTGPAPDPTLALGVDGQIVDTFVVAGTAASPAARTHALVVGDSPVRVRYVPQNFINDAAANNANDVIVTSLALRSDAEVTPTGRDLVYTCEPTGSAGDACPDQILQAFASRAWRRPIDAPEIAWLEGLHDTLSAQAASPDEALRLSLTAILVSPKFLYRSQMVGPIDERWPDWELASRLSYFLWSSMPDARLRDMAADGGLSTAQGVRDAVAWMVLDDKARGLVDGFAAQWLSTRLLQTAALDQNAFPAFDDELRAAMREETHLLFGDFLSNGLAASDLLDPPIGYLNERLATHYGLPGVTGPDLVRVALADDERRGVLSLGAWLSATSDVAHSSPIRRGAWVSDHILCAPVPPPPSNLVIEPVELDDDGPTSVREQLEAHRTDPVCAGCHASLDVLGMGFEVFDGDASPRTVADSLGELIDGRTFVGADELADLLDRTEFASCLQQKLLTYGAGRVLTFEDRRWLASLVDPDATLPELLADLAASPLFHPVE